MNEYVISKLFLVIGGIIAGTFVIDRGLFGEFKLFDYDERNDRVVEDVDKKLEMLERTDESYNKYYGYNVIGKKTSKGRESAENYK